jgi:hypothetical protein
MIFSATICLAIAHLLTGPNYMWLCFVADRIDVKHIVLTTDPDGMTRLMINTAFVMNCTYYQIIIISGQSIVMLCRVKRKRLLF